MQRIETFLKEDEVPDWATSLKRKNTGRKPLPPLPSESSRPSQLGPGKGKGKDERVVGFENGIFTWSMMTRRSLHAPFKLGPLNLNFPTGELSLISGATGSGKTALLLSLLGGGFSEVSVVRSPKRFAYSEMACVDGKVFIDKSNGKVAYCAQTPCTFVVILNTGETNRALGLEHATIRDNIIFGSRFGPFGDGLDEARYDAVLDACALKRDLGIFQAGDLTGVHQEHRGIPSDR